MIRLTFEGARGSDMLAYLEALSIATNKYQERDRMRKGVWRRGGVKGQVRDAYAKAERLFFQAFHSSEAPDEDDLVDIINYAAFALMLMREAKDERPEPGYDRDGFVAEEHEQRMMNGKWPW